MADTGTVSGRHVPVLSQRSGFTLLEMVVVIAIISTLGLFAIQRLLEIQVAAERVAMDTVLGNMRSAIGLKFVYHVTKHDMGAIRSLAGSNPMDQMAETPANYIGALTTQEADSLEKGIWYFDQDARALVYRVRNESYFEGDAEGSTRARFQVQVLYGKPKARRRPRRARNIEGLRLVALEPYRWTN